MLKQHRGPPYLSTMSQARPLSTDAVMKMFRCDDFPPEGLIVQLNRTSRMEGITGSEPSA
eukprot:CAMPEP_0185738260 /NCGR_PEP_ID=MMETSP1171-20130828/32425_1 /TAXON_ID=374046 /ORGANISM="Helicotheca tamensis, Strain CCMP826" /LENGTH=59 /DNA_ID=CAMNT_0028409427 /DNA_START=1 /DNA_END=176 /DNA_ORIENTATION=-